MKKLIFVFLFLTACGHSGGSGDTAPSTIAQPPSQGADHSPHDYTMAVLPTNANSGLTFHQVCNFGVANFRDDGVQTYGFSQSQNQFAVGAAGCTNYTIDVTVTGGSTIYVAFAVDNVFGSTITLVPAQHYTFQRGF